ncbi:MAG: hypothetical protein N3B13_02520 [Deltaproteobacteria bacterium]|nr:hypothetical protein [Deltaproteobacteria bacterium]
MIRIYEFVFLFLFMLSFPFLFLFPRVRNTVFKRLYLSERKISDRDSVWFHGASAGDILSLKPVIDFYYRKYRERYNIVVTSNTESGRDIVKRFFPGDVFFAYLPFDIFFSVQNFLKIYRPVMLFVEASEFWPVLIDRTYKKGVRIVLINGNIKKEKKYLYMLLSFLASGLFEKYELMIMRNEESLACAKYLGADENKVLLCTNTKYKNVFSMKENGFPEGLKEAFGSFKRLIVFGSVHYEEEDEILYVTNKLLETFRDIKIVIAPRHLERTEPLIRKIKMSGMTKQFSVSRFTGKDYSSDVLILDTIGDLFYIYSFATVAFVGGSLADRGGHNVLEPSVWGVPVITGKYVRNYEDIVKLLLGYGLIIAGGREELLDVISEILRDDERRKSLSEMLNSRISLIRKEFGYIETIFETRLTL